MSFEMIRTELAGCVEIQPRVLRDPRGSFVKVVHHPTFADHGLKTNFTEQYYSVSQKGVLRGLHFQTPPHDHVKLVYCVVGEVFDVVVDLRVGSKTYGQFATFRLSEERGNMVYIPEGMAHGFYVLSEQATLVYNVSTVHQPDHDAGIRWDSAGVPWPLEKGEEPCLSPRDTGLPKLIEYRSPFRAGERAGS